jgi:hypothetical protein
MQQVKEISRLLAIKTDRARDTLTVVPRMKVTTII